VLSLPALLIYLWAEPTQAYWLESKFLKITFEDEVSCDIEDIRMLLDTYSPNEKGES
jgi:tRNA uridine 5-carbamoylmethylation protein Kti12